MEMNVIHNKNKTDNNDVLVKIEEESEPTNEVMLKPGSQIKPIVTPEDVKKLAQRLYGIVVAEMKELNAYDDVNYFIQPDLNIKNPIIKAVCQHGYILKITNSLDSKDESFFDAQIHVLLHLNKKGIKCPVPVENIFGRYHSLEHINGSTHIVRLLEFMPGKTFHEITPKDNLFYQTGKIVASIDNALKSFQHDAYKTRRSIWMLEEVPKLKEFVNAVRDEDRRELVEDILETYEKNIMPVYDTFERGIIHGDCNEHNLICDKKQDNNEEYEVLGIIDFGDSSYSCYIFELAIAMTYMMLESGLLQTGGLVMAGYTMVRNIRSEEKQFLKLCIASRLCQSLVMGLYTASTVKSSNEYILSSQIKGWTLLESIWNTPDSELLELWESVCEHYLTQSSK